MRSRPACHWTRRVWEGGRAPTHPSPKTCRPVVPTIAAPRPGPPAQEQDPMTSSALDRLPALATTGVGSLPFDDPAAAVRHAVHAYDLPFCPQLPALDGDMVRE